jgi:hypothetical protein
MAYYASPGWLWWWRNWWNDWQGKPKYSEKTRPNAALSTQITICCTDARAAAVGSQRLTASATARPICTCYNPQRRIRGWLWITDWEDCRRKWSWVILRYRNISLPWPQNPVRISYLLPKHPIWGLLNSKKVCWLLDVEERVYWHFTGSVTYTVKASTWQTIRVDLYSSNKIFIFIINTHSL